MPTPEYSSLFICPQTGQKLRQATSEELASIQVAGEPTLDAAWIREDSAVAYPVKKGIPLLVPASAIPLKNTPPSRKETLSHD
jgi:uncharacterized protein YbaR (Trm112 family)